MRSMFIVLLSSFIVYSCGSNRQLASQQPAPQTTSATATVKADNPKNQDCQNEAEGVVLSEEEAARYENLIRQGEYYNSNRYTQPRTNLNGAAGAGTGASYASSYYGSQKKKEPAKVCKPSGKITVREVPKETQGKYYTTSGRDNEDKIIRNEVVNGRTADTDQMTKQQEEDAWLNDEWSDKGWNDEEAQQEQRQEEDALIQEEEEEDVEYDEVPW